MIFAAACKILRLVYNACMLCKDPVHALQLD